MRFRELRSLLPSSSLDTDAHLLKEVVRGDFTKLEDSPNARTGTSEMVEANRSSGIRAIALVIGHHGKLPIEGVMRSGVPACRR